MAIMQDFIVTAFYTINTPYAIEIEQNLIKSLKQRNIPYYIEKIENKGSWRQNTAYKPQLALNAMANNPDKNILMLDADSQVLGDISIFNNIPEEFDVAAHILDWDSWYLNQTHVKEFLSGTLFLRNNEKTKELAKEWLAFSANSKLWEQKVLETAIKRRGIKVYELPLEYCYISTLPDGRKPYVRCNDVRIVHHQASRRYRTLVSRLKV